MPITYEQFINGYCIVAFDLTANQDTHLAVLPSRVSGVVERNKSWDKKPARLLYDI